MEALREALRHPHRGRNPSVDLGGALPQRVAAQFRGPEPQGAAGQWPLPPKAGRLAWRAAVVAIAVAAGAAAAVHRHRSALQAERDREPALNRLPRTSSRQAVNLPTDGASESCRCGST
jgi:hypothetical protein